MENLIHEEGEFHGFPGLGIIEEHALDKAIGEQL